MLGTQKCYITFISLEEDISDEEEVRASETGSISQKRPHSEV